MDKTILCVLGDHGVSLRAHDRFGRWAPYEELIRIPWVLRWPGHLTPGTRIDWPCSQLDVTPTLLTLMGFDISAVGFDGRDALTPSDPNRRLYFYTAFPNSPLGVVEGDRKWAYWPSADSVFEYDLRLDPNEESPRVLDPAEKEPIVGELLRWQEQSRFLVTPRRFAENVVFVHWRTFSSGRTAWAYYVP